MKKVTGYKLSNGEFVEDEKEAIEREKELTVESRLRAFCEDHIVHDMSPGMVGDTLIDYRNNLREILEQDGMVFSSSELRYIAADVECVMSQIGSPNPGGIRKIILEKIKRT